MRARDALARGLLAVGATPNMLTAIGLAATCAAGACLFVGASHRLPLGDRADVEPASWWPLWAAACLFTAGAMDMLDGALARAGKLQTPFGGVLDSVLDRIGDAALFGGCALHFAAEANMTYTALSLLGLTSATMTSYIKARAECVIDRCDAGYWQRGERLAAFLIAAATGHVPAAIWVLGVLPVFTVVRRVRQVYGLLSPSGKPWEPSGVWWLLTPWRHARGSVGYDLVTGTNIAFLIAGPWLFPFATGRADPLAVLLAG